MNSELFADLVWKNQMGDSDALEQLLLNVYAPVSYLAGKILQDEDRANQVTQEVLETISGKLNSLGDPDQFQKWMCRITAARCMRVMPLFHYAGKEPQTPATWKESLTDGETLTEEQSAQIIQQMVDALPQNQRLCILLLSCGGLSVSAIAQLTGFSDSTVTEYIQQGQAAIQQYLWELQSRDIQFSGLSSLTGILRVAMFRQTETADAIPVVYGILGKEIPVPPDPEKQIIRILSVILAVLIVAVLVVSGIIVMKMVGGSNIKSTPPSIETILPATTEAAEPTTVSTLAETTIPTEISAMKAAEAVPSTETTVPSTETPSSPTNSAPVAPSAPSTGNQSGTPADAPATGEDGHTHQYTVISSSFDCENGGSKTHQCSVCGLCYEEAVPASGSHNFLVIPGSDPSCTRAGQITKACKVCNHGYMTDDPDRPALGHDYQAALVVPPTETTQGYTWYKCTRCSDSYDADFVDPLPQSGSASDEQTAN
ncbi:MAG: sigma factor-like helix-turn-helix DNA-binding protein [Faecousia sp.]